MGAVARVFAFNRAGVNIPRGLIIVGVLLLQLLVLVPAGLERYWLSVAFGSLFVALSDPGGAFAFRARGMGAVGLVGAALTALRFAVGTTTWVLIAFLAFAVTLFASAAVAWGAHRFVAASLLNVWFLVALSASAGGGGGAATHWWQQTLAWLAGSALWLVVCLVVWLARRRATRPSRFPEIPDDVKARTLTRPMLLFAVIRALAVGIAVAVAFGLKLPNADWMPIATLVAMKSTLGQAALASTQRLVGAILGALIATLFIVTLDIKPVLEAALVVLMAVAASIRAASYALYCTAVAAAALLGIGLAHPASLAAEWQRVLFTFVGIAIGLLVLLVGNLLAKRQPHPGPPPASRASGSA